MIKNFDLEVNEDLITKFEYINKMPGYIIVKNNELKYQSISKDFVKFGGGINSNEAIGKTVYEIPSKYSKYADSIADLDKKVLIANQTAGFIDIYDFDCERMIFLCQKTPLKDKNGDVKGIYINSLDVTSFINEKYRILNYLDRKFINEKFSMKQYTLTPSFSPLSLSPRQQDCLSLLIRGKAMKEIAFILGISARTVETHFEVMKHKLKCYNKSQLIEKAINSGFIFHISANLLGLDIF